MESKTTKARYFIEREHYTIHPGRPTTDGEGFVRIDGLSADDQLLIVGVGGLIRGGLHHVDSENETPSEIAGVRNAILNPLLYGPNTVIVTTLDGVDMDQKVDAWLQTRLAESSTDSLQP
jgi:hypothetical protein